MTGAACAAVIGAALMLTGCSGPELPPPPEATECSEPSTAGAPGEADVVFTYGASMSGWSAFGPSHQSVVYADGAVAVWEDTPAAAFPPAGRMLAPLRPDTPGAFRAGELNACATSEFLDMLADVFEDPDRDFGTPQITDVVSTGAEYRAPGEQEVTSYWIYAAGMEEDSDLTREQLSARYEVFAMEAFLEVNLTEGELIRPETLEVLSWPGGGTAIPEQWPVEDFEEFSVNGECGVLSGADAQEVLEAILGGSAVPDGLSVLTLAPGIAGCGQ